MQDHEALVRFSKKEGLTVTDVVLEYARTIRRRFEDDDRSAKSA
jgi:hypothetical protein